MGQTREPSRSLRERTAINVLINRLGVAVTNHQAEFLIAARWLYHNSHPMCTHVCSAWDLLTGQLPLLWIPCGSSGSRTYLSGGKTTQKGRGAVF